MKLEWRESPAAHHPYGVVWELIDAELDFVLNDYGQPEVRARLSPIYATIVREGERQYTAYVRIGFPIFESKTFDSLPQAQAWAQALTILIPPT